MNFIRSICILIFSVSFYSSQNQYKKWYFGDKAGLDFMTSPPTALPASAMFVSEGCASIADQNGNLLFYTDGKTIWNQSHVIMANGNAINIASTPSQSALIIKKPSSTNLYYVFTMGDGSGIAQMRYCIVDMNLSAGMGSVTVKGDTLIPNLLSSEKLTGAKHCNNQDYWIVTRNRNSCTFFSFLLTAAGLNTIAVVSSIGSDSATSWGCMKISPNGRKIAVCRYKPDGLGGITVNEFDNSTGIVLSNSIVISVYPNTINGGISYGLPYGIEFSPDGSKLYVSISTPPSNPPFPQLYQFDLCAGNEQAVNASIYAVNYGLTTSSSGGALQLGPDGKIYKASGTLTLGVINNPNSSGVACNYNNNGQVLLYPNASTSGLPNFITSDFAPPQSASQFSFAIKCQNVSFTGIPGVTPGNNCAANTYPPMGSTWSFGDPASGINNTSTASNPVHFYQAVGTYTVKLILNYQCRADTVIQQIIISSPGPTVTLTGKTNICKNQTVTLNANGALSYTWAPVNFTTTMVSVSPSVTTVYTVTGKDANGCSATNTIQLTVNPCTGIAEQNYNEVLNIYPNPNDGKFYIETTVNTDFEIYNQLGVLIFNGKATSGKQMIDIGSLTNGIYFVRLGGDHGGRTLKLVKVD